MQHRSFCAAASVRTLCRCRRPGTHRQRQRGEIHGTSAVGESLSAKPPQSHLSPRTHPTASHRRSRRRSAAVTCMGCNAGSQPFALSLVEGFVTELGKETAPRLGDCWGGAIRHYVKAYKLPELK